ncbi:MAG: hypothetical protein GY754_24265 [bacterium]|nr:hypothetical protein [bacterium]
MKRKTICIISLVLAILHITISQKAEAHGVGFFGGSGIGALTLNKDQAGIKDPISVYFEGGIIYDSNIATNRIFNYRFNLSFGYEDIQTDKNSGRRIFIDNTFGFGIIRNESIRLWLGPQVCFGRYTGTRTSEEESSGYFSSSKNKYGFLIFEFGLAIGINIHISESISLSFDTGLHLGLCFGSIGNMDDGIIGLGTVNGYLNAGVLYRFSSDIF